MKNVDVETLVAQRAASKTYWFGLAIMLLGYVQDNFPLIDHYLGQYDTAVKFAIGFVIILLREVTTKALKEKGNATKT